MDIYRKAQHIIHRNHGVLSLLQIPVLRQISTLYLLTGNTYAADTAEKFAFDIGTRDPDQPIKQKLSAYEMLASHYLNSGNFIQAILVYQQELRLLKDSGMGDANSYYLPLKGIANTCQQSGQQLKTGIRALEALNLRLNDIDIDHSDYLAVQVQLADLYLLHYDYEKATKLYKKIWDSEKDTTQLSLFFAEPRLIFPEGRNTPFLYHHEETDLIDISVDVDNRGKISTYVVNDGTLSRYQRSQIQSWLRLNRFRPRIVEGELVAAEDLTIAGLLE
jgi:tetratricopeptide (TPR) repeat protein